MEAVEQEGWLLRICPPEIREMILKEALKSKNGKIMFRCLSRDNRRGCIVEDDVLWHDSDSGYAYRRLYIDSNDTVMGTLPLTCRTIYAETTGLLWQFNTVVTNLEHTSYLVRHCPLYMRTLSNHVVHIQLDLQRWNEAEVEKLRYTLRILRFVSTRGRLKTITLCPVRGLMNVLKLGELRQDPLSVRDGIFRSVRDLLSKTRSYFSGTQVQLKISVSTGWPSLSTYSKVYFRRSTSRDFLSIERRQNCAHKFDPVLKSLKQLHYAFGGELWQDDTLCYKDRKELCQPFKLPPNAEHELTMLDRQMFRDAMMRRAIYKAPRTVNAMELPAEIRAHLFKGREDLRKVDVSHMKMSPLITVNIFPNWNDRHDRLTKFVSRDHPVFYLQWKERCLSQNSCPQECRCEQCIPV